MMYVSSLLHFILGSDRSLGHGSSSRMRCEENVSCSVFDGQFTRLLVVGKVLCSIGWGRLRGGKQRCFPYVKFCRMKLQTDYFFIM